MRFNITCKLSEEYDIYSKTTRRHGRWFIPVNWIANHLSKAVKEKIITLGTMQVSDLKSK